MQTQVNILQEPAASAFMIECGGTSFLRNIHTSVPDCTVLSLDIHHSENLKSHKVWTVTFYSDEFATDPHVISALFLWQ